MAQQKEKPQHASYDPILRNPFPSAHHFFDHHWTGPRSSSIYLELLAISPSHQGQGHAKQLIQWGLERAKEEGVGASVVSSMAGYEFYKKMGFVVCTGKVTEGVGNPLSGLKSGWILFTEDGVEVGERQGVINGEDAQLRRDGRRIEQSESEDSEDSVEVETVHVIVKHDGK